MGEVKNKLINAYQTLLKNDGYLLKVGANERSLTHKLAMYLQDEFPTYHVDCEYNRVGIHPKKLDSFKRNICSDDTDGSSVYPDIIIHHRGTNNNFIVIEAKKSTNCSNDDEKLLAYKNDLKYKYAFAIIFPVDKFFSIYNSDRILDYIKEK